MFLNRNKKNNVYPCKSKFYYIKVVFKGSKLYRYVFVMYLEKKRYTSDANKTLNSADTSILHMLRDSHFYGISQV